MDTNVLAFRCAAQRMWPWQHPSVHICSVAAQACRGDACHSGLVVQTCTDSCRSVLTICRGSNCVQHGMVNGASCQLDSQIDDVCNALGRVRLCRDPALLADSTLKHGQSLCVARCGASCMHVQGTTMLLMYLLNMTALFRSC